MGQKAAESAIVRRPATRATQVTDDVRAVLLDGRLEPGTRINEVQLARMLSVSRTPIRAALQTLAGEGLLDYRPNRGFTVRAFDIAEIGDAFELRALAEGLAARLAAERGLSPEDRAEMEEALRQGDQVTRRRMPPEQRRAAYAAANTAFHGVVRRAAGSRLLEETLRLCSRVPQTLSHNVVAFEADDIAVRHAAHHRIFEAILFRRPREAETLMREHVVGVKTSFVHALTRAPEPKPAPARERAAMLQAKKLLPRGSAARSDAALRGSPAQRRAGRPVRSGA